MNRHAYQPVDAARRTRSDQARVRVYVWDGVVRVCHWLAALSTFVLAGTGFYLGRPFVIVSGEAGQAFTMGAFKAVHFGAAIVFSLAVLVRVYWSFFGGRNARWRNYLPLTPESREDLKKALSFYLLMRERSPFTLNHHPLAGLCYVAFLLMCLTMIGTGLGLYAASAHEASLFRVFDFLPAWLGGLQTLRWVHHVVMWLILVFFVVHLYASLLTARVEQNGLLDSIFTGFKWVKREDLDE